MCSTQNVGVNRGFYTWLTILRRESIIYTNIYWNVQFEFTDFNLFISEWKFLT